MSSYSHLLGKRYMYIFIAWPNWLVRQDRCVMFSQTAEWADATYFITSTRLPDSLRDRLHPQSQVLYVPETTRKLNFILAANKIVQKVAAEFPPGSQILFQELALPRLTLFAYFRRWLPRNSYRSVLSFYSANATAIQSRDWRTTPEQRLPWKVEMVHFRVALARFLTDLAMVRGVDAVSGNSEEIYQGVVNIYKKKPENVFLMPTAIDIDYFKPKAGHEREIQTILFLGRLYTRKGVLDLIEACGILKQRRIPFRLQLMGDNHLETETIDHFIEEHQVRDKVSFIPRQPREIVREALHKATVFVLPSYQEGSPRVVKEAMAAGCPVIVTNLPGIRLLDPMEESLCFVSPGDPGLLANKLANVLMDRELQQSMSRSGLSIVTNHYSPPQVAEQMFKLYTILFEKK